MPIKHEISLSKEDFASALRHPKVRKTVSEVAKETGIPRTYLSEFRTGERNLKPEFLAKLRGYFEDQGVEFDDDARAPGDKGRAAQSPHPRLSVQTVTKCYFPIDDDLPAETISAAMDAMDANDARLIELFRRAARRDDGLFGDGGFDSATKETLQEAFSALAENYIIFRMMRGWPAFDRLAEKQEFETVRDVMLDTFGVALAEAGLFEVDHDHHEYPEIDPEAEPESEQS